MSKYQKIVKERGLENYVIFHGYLMGDELDEFYNGIDLGICSLGGHRKGLYGFTSELKSREYLARGLAVVSSMRIDVFDEWEFPYKLYVPQDESNISIERIVEFYEQILQTKTTGMIAEEIRKYAMKKVGLEKMVEPVAEYIGNILTG